MAAACFFFYFVSRRCKVMDMRLGELAPRHLETKFLRIDAEKAPFFVQKLQVCVVFLVPRFVLTSWPVFFFFCLRLKVPSRGDRVALERRSSAVSSCYV